MNIGFDLDNVFVSTPPFIPPVIIERLYGRKHNGRLVYRIPSGLEQVIRSMSHYPVFRPLIKDNLNIIRNIGNKNHKLYLVSSRFGFLKKRTAGLIKRHKLGDLFTQMYFNYDNQQPHIFKNDVIKKLALDRFIDDDLDLLKYIAGHNNNIRLFWYNKKYDKKISSSIRAVTDIADIFTS